MFQFNYGILDSSGDFIGTVTCGKSIESKTVENLLLIIAKFQKLTKNPIIFYTILLMLMVLYACF